MLHNPGVVCRLPMRPCRTDNPILAALHPTPIGASSQSALRSPSLCSPVAVVVDSPDARAHRLSIIVIILMLSYCRSCRTRPGRSALQPGRHPHQGPDETPGHLLEVVTPLENHSILIQIRLVPPSERPQEVPQSRPDPLRRVVVHLANPIPIVTPRPLPRRMADRDVPPADPRQAAVARPLVGVHRGLRPGRAPHP